MNLTSNFPYLQTRKSCGWWRCHTWRMVLASSPHQFTQPIFMRWSPNWNTVGLDCCTLCHKVRIQNPMVIRENSKLKTVAFIAGKKNPAIQIFFICCSIENMIANISFYVLSWPKLNFGCYLTFEIIFKVYFNFGLLDFYLR